METAFIFDWDGVCVSEIPKTASWVIAALSMRDDIHTINDSLINSLKSGSGMEVRAAVDALALIRSEYEEELKQVAGFTGLPRAAMAQRVWDVLVAPFPHGGDVSVMVERRNAIKDSLIAIGSEQIDGTLRLITAAADKGVPMAIVTQATTPSVRDQAAYVGFPLNLMQAVECAGDPEYLESGDGVDRKAEAFKAACTQLGIEPSSAIAFEDTDAGITAATSAGLSCIGLRAQYNNQALKLARVIVSDLGHIAMPEVLQEMLTLETNRGQIERIAEALIRRGVTFEGELALSEELRHRYGWTLEKVFTRGGSSAQVYLVRNAKGKQYVVKYAIWPGIDGNGTNWVASQYRRLRQLRKDRFKPYPKVYPKYSQDSSAVGEAVWFAMEYFANAEELPDYIYKHNLDMEGICGLIERLLTQLSTDLRGRARQSSEIQYFPEEIMVNHIPRANHRAMLLPKHAGDIYTKRLQGAFHLPPIIPGGVGLEYPDPAFADDPRKDVSYFFEDLLNQENIVIDGRVYPNLLQLLTICEDHCRSGLLYDRLAPTHHKPGWPGDLNLRNVMIMPDGSFKLIDPRGLNVHEHSPDKTSIEYDLGKIAHSFVMEVVRRDSRKVHGSLINGILCFESHLEESPNSRRFMEARDVFYNILKSHSLLNELLDNFEDEAITRWIENVRFAECANYASDAIHRMSQDQTGHHSLLLYLEATVALYTFLKRHKLISSYRPVLITEWFKKSRRALSTMREDALHQILGYPIERARQGQPAIIAFNGPAYAGQSDVIEHAQEYLAQDYLKKANLNVVRIDLDSFRKPETYPTLLEQLEEGDLHLSCYTSSAYRWTDFLREIQHYSSPAINTSNTVVLVTGENIVTPETSHLFNVRVFVDVDSTQALRKRIPTGSVSAFDTLHEPLASVMRLTTIEYHDYLLDTTYWQRGYPVLYLKADDWRREKVRKILATDTTFPLTITSDEPVTFDNRVWAASIDEIHGKGIPHLGVSVLAIDPNDGGKVVFQKRSPEKTVFPNRLDVIGAHVDKHHECYLDAAVERIKMELLSGIDRSRFVRVGRDADFHIDTRHQAVGHNIEFKSVYVLSLTPEEMLQIRAAKQEVANFWKRSKSDRDAEVIREAERLSAANKDGIHLANRSPECKQYYISCAEGNYTRNFEVQDFEFMTLERAVGLYKDGNHDDEFADGFFKLFVDTPDAALYVEKVQKTIKIEIEKRGLIREEFERRLRHREGARYDDNKEKMTFRIDQAIDWCVGQRPKYDLEIVNLWGSEGLNKAVDLFASTLRSAGNSPWIYSSGPGTGESTMWRELTRSHPGQFQKLLLHTSRMRRLDPRFDEYIVPEHPLYGPLMCICEALEDGVFVDETSYGSALHQFGYSKDTLRSQAVTVGESEPQSLSLWIREVVDITVFGAEGRRYTNVPGKPMEISLSERLELTGGLIRVYGEFDGVDYIYTLEEEIIRRGELPLTDQDHLTVYPFGSELVLGVSLHEIRRAIAGEYGDTGRITAMAAMPEIALDLVSRDGIGDGIKTVFISPLDTSSSEREARLPDAQD